MWHHRPGPHVHAIGPQAQAGSGLFRYIVATSWAHQLSLVALTTAVFLLEIVPLELQRRIINDLEKHRLYVPILLLCAAYATAVLVQGTTKLGLNIYRSWVGERAKRELRRRIIALKTVTAGSRSVGDAQGTAISMVIAEVEPIGGFIGESVSEPLLQTGILVAIIAYLVHLDAWMGAAAIALFRYCKMG